MSAFWWLFLIFPTNWTKNRSLCKVLTGHGVDPWGWVHVTMRAWIGCEWIVHTSTLLSFVWKVAVSLLYLLLPCSHRQDSLTHTHVRACTHLLFGASWSCRLIQSSYFKCHYPNRRVCCSVGAKFNLTRKSPRNHHSESASFIFNGTPPHCTSAVLPPGCSATFAKTKQKKVPL